MSRHSYTILLTLSRPTDCQDRNVKTGLNWFQMFQNGSCLNFGTGLDKVYHCAKSVLALLSSHATFHWSCWILNTLKCTLILISKQFIAILVLCDDHIKHPPWRNLNCFWLAGWVCCKLKVYIHCKDRSWYSYFLHIGVCVWLDSLNTMSRPVLTLHCFTH